MSPAGLLAEPMGLQWSHDIEVQVHKNVIIELSAHVHANDVAMRYILCVTLTMITFRGDTAERPEFPDRLSPCAGGTIHPTLQK